MGKSSPDTPDYEGAAEATAAGNRVDQYTPFGSQIYDSTGYDAQGNPTYSQTTNLNPEAQRALDAQLGLTGDRSEMGRDIFGRVASEMGNAPDYSGFQGYGDVPDAGGSRDRAETAIYDRATSRLDPRMQQGRSDMEAKLAAQGLRPGDAAYDREIENFGRYENDAYNQAQMSSIIGGGQESSRDFGLNMQQSGYENTLRQQQIAETMQQRGFSLNEINALLSGQQVGMPQMPNYSGGADYSGAMQQGYQGDLNESSAKNAGTQGLMQGAATAGMMALMMSDRRLKRNIHQIGTFKGYAWYVWDYVWGESQCGVMADEINQEAVVITPSGYAAVDYSRIR